jgi:hypothetical protein
MAIELPNFMLMTLNYSRVYKSKVTTVIYSISWTAWSKTWQLHISYSKCNVMVIHQIGNCADPQLHIDNLSI